MTRRFFLLCLLLPLLFPGCSRARKPLPEAPAPLLHPHWEALAILEPGEHPLWFELGPEGPSLIPSPSGAALNPYTPWPQARFIAGALMDKGNVIMGVNREGFLILSPGGSGGPGSSGGPESSGLVLYRAAEKGAWDPYTIGTLFFWEDHPAALLYREDFFMDSGAAPLPHPAFILREDRSAPEAVPVPALDPPGGGWESDSLRRGPDGFWYLRQVQKGADRPGTLYFRTPSLARAGEGVSLGDWRNSAAPGDLSSAPPLLGEALRFFSGLLEQGGTPAVRILSEDFAGTAAFAAPGFGSGGEGVLWLRGYYQSGGGTPQAGKGGEKALAILGGGRGVYALPGEAPRRFALPELPEGFTYTGIALAGDAAAAFWEEQDDAGIGAAGFMVMKSPFPR